MEALLNVLKGLIREDIEITKSEGGYFITKIDNQRYSNIKLEIESDKDKIFNLEHTFILKYNDKVEMKVFHKGDLEFPIMRTIKKLEIDAIDILPLKPIDVLVKSSETKNIGADIRYKTKSYIVSGIVNAINAIKEDGVEYSIYVNNRVYI